jgi:hypothetical protein
LFALCVSAEAWALLAYLRFTKRKPAVSGTANS